MQGALPRFSGVEVPLKTRVVFGLGAKRCVLCTGEYGTLSLDRVYN